MLIYYDAKGNEVARLLFDKSYATTEEVDKALFDAISSVLPVDNSSEDDEDDECAEE